MAASKTTVQEILAIIRKYVPDEHLATMIHELTFVQGNKSVQETIRALDAEYLRTCYEVASEEEINAAAREGTPKR